MTHLSLTETDLAVLAQCASDPERYHSCRVNAPELEASGLVEGERLLFHKYSRYRITGLGMRRLKAALEAARG